METETPSTQAGESTSDGRPSKGRGAASSSAARKLEEVSMFNDWAKGIPPKASAAAVHNNVFLGKRYWWLNVQ